MCTYVSRTLVSTWMATNTMAIMEIRRWSSCWAKPGQLRARARVVVASPRTMVSGEQDEGHDPTRPRDVPEDGRAHAASSSGQPPRVKTSARRGAPGAPPGRTRRRRRVPVAPDDGGGRERVGVHAARHRWPRPRSSTARRSPRRGSTMWWTVSLPDRPRPHGGARAGQATLADGHDLVHVVARASTSRLRCRSATLGGCRTGRRRRHHRCSPVPPSPSSRRCGRRPGRRRTPWPMTRGRGGRHGGCGPSACRRFEWT